MNTQKLRDMNLNSVADEIEQLRKFKAEVESQKPIFYSVHRREHEPSNAVCFNDIEVANKYVSNNYDLCVSALYAKPVPADKPVVAVPDEWRRIVERAANMMRMSGVVSHKDSLNPLHSWLHDAESLLDAPSHSQQSAHDSEQEDSYPPPHVIDEWRTHCSCCPHCGNHPCDGVSAGGMCDNAECNCSYDCDSEQGGE